MRRVKTRTERISVSAKCFSIIALILCYASHSYALTVSGLPDWLQGAVVRSLNAVWSEIPDSPEIDREGTLAIVASRLFAGYDVSVKAKREGPAIFFLPHEDELIHADVKIISPDLRGMSLQWFADDTSGMSDEVASVVDALPQSALTWADEALREKLKAIVEARLPGWNFTQQIYIGNQSTLVNLSFRPGESMILAVKPEIYSRTLPVMFRSYLESLLVPALSPLIGVPVKWAELHKADIEKFSHDFLEDRHTVENMKAYVSIKFSPGKISGLNARVDSENFFFQLWVSAYAGLNDRYPEAGAFFGYSPNWSFHTEFYAELLFSLEDFGITHRIGGRFELFDNIWMGIENQWPENSYFFRLQYIPVRIRRPYVLWRYSPELDAHEAALGYIFDEHISVEIYYDSTGDNKIGIRGTWHL
jgi:hypothetical protein